MKHRGSSLRSLVLVAPFVVSPLACSLLVESALSEKPSGLGGAGGASGAGGVGGASGAGGTAGTGGTGGTGGAMCVGGCSAPLTCCMDGCVDLGKDKANCGACGQTCVGAQVCCGDLGCVDCCTAADCPTVDHVCNANKCELQCSGVEIDCGTECADIQTSSSHCGACDNDCLAGHACVMGACEPGWASMSKAGAPSARQHAAAAWTGSRLFVWGGKDGVGVLGDGALYDPKTDLWSAVSDVNAPSPRADAAAVPIGIGTRVLVWGGGPAMDGSTLNNGKIYDSTTDMWSDVVDAPIGRRQSIALWTGDRALIWGGMSNNSPIAGGALFDPNMNKWSTIAGANAPNARSGVSFAWSTNTKELLIFGGRPNGVLSTNEAFGYSPETNTWRKLATPGMLAARYDAFSVWLGSQMFIYGGRDAAGGVFDDAGKYDPLMDVWTAAAPPNPPGKRSAPFGRTGWTGSTGALALVIGGIDAAQKPKIDGEIYRSMDDMWPGTVPNFPSTIDHEYGVGVWTGAEMILWSGLDNNTLSAEGERYRP